ncbi:MAG: exodeoxyribonuclease VII small subunit [Anaerolineaceae bacterium]|nr:exodeoxyribonuclease VII small subunit [Anaerolineaceae bacterium]
MAKTPTPAQDLTYEQALAKLETLLSALEGESKDLEGTMVMFERGKALITRCQELLDKAELKVKQLSANGELMDLEEQD